MDPQQRRLVTLLGHFATQTKPIVGEAAFCRDELQNLLDNDNHQMRAQVRGLSKERFRSVSSRHRKQPCLLIHIMQMKDFMKGEVFIPR